MFNIKQLSKEQIENLIEEAFECLKIGDLDNAIKLGKKLKKYRHTSAFEVLAKAYADKGELNNSIKILRDGIKITPELWILWMLLGNYLSDKEEFSKACEAYERSIQCCYADLSVIWLNYAIACFRNKHYQKSLDCIEKVQSKECQLQALYTKICIFNIIQQFEDAKKLAYSLLENPLLTDNDKLLSDIYAELAYTYCKGCLDNRTAIQYALESIKHNKHQIQAQYCLRDAENLMSQQSIYYRIMITGKWHQAMENKDGEWGFYTTYTVVAENQEEAMSFIKRFEPTEILDSIKIEEIKEMKLRSDDPKGVYGTTGYAFFALEDD